MSPQPPGPRLETARLVLRRWEPADLAPFAALNADPEVMRHFRARLTRDQSDAFVARIEAGFEELGYGLWALEERASGGFLGFAGLARQIFDAPFNPSVEVGWRLAREAWGHGFATEAARASVDHAFGAAGLDALVSITTVGNERSRAVMRRLGMTHDPAEDFDQAGLPAGHPLRHAVLYRLRRDQWPPAPADGSR